MNELEKKKYTVKKYWLTSYDVGRDEIGEVQQEFNAGDIIVGQEEPDGTIRYLAVYSTSEKSYSTPIFLNPDMLSRKISGSINPLKINKGELSRMIILALGLTFGLYITRKK
jgi:hypothetical protein